MQRLEAGRQEVESDLAARTDNGVDVRTILAGLDRLVDVFEALEDVADRRRLLQQCLSRIVVRAEGLEVHVRGHRVIIPPEQPPEGRDSGETVPGFFHRAPSGPLLPGPENGDFEADFPAGVQVMNAKSMGVDERTRARADSTATRRARVRAPTRW